MKVHQLYTGSMLRNFTYVLQWGQTDALCVDPFEAEQVLDFLNEKQLNLKYIVNTHEHWDHIQGNEKLHNCTGATILAHKNGEGKIPNVERFLEKDDLVELDDDHYLKVLDTPGHTFAHLCLLLFSKGTPYAVFTGDTLFNAGVGNCHNGGDANVLYQTISEQFCKLDHEILLYPGHEYMGNNLQFTLSLEDNADAIELFKKYEESAKKGDWIITNLGQEKRVNAFLRLDSKNIQNSVTERLYKGKKPCELSEKDVFLGLRKLRDNW